MGNDKMDKHVTYRVSKGGGHGVPSAVCFLDQVVGGFPRLKRGRSESDADTGEYGSEAGYFGDLNGGGSDAFAPGEYSSRRNWKSSSNSSGVTEREDAPSSM